MSNLEEKVLKTINKFSLLSKGDRVVVGFSGGADSTALLHILHKLKHQLDIELMAVHVNHGIRITAVEDESFCIDFCRKRGIEIITFREDILKISKEKRLSLEEAGRLVRYKIFNKVLRNKGFNKIATAHHLNDNVETFLLRLFKGTSLRGLSSIRPKLRNIIRPLIECRKEEIISYLKENDIKFVSDETNYDLSYERNYIRNVIIPSINARFPAFESKLDQLIRDIWKLKRFIDGVSSKVFRSCVKREENGLVVDLGKLKKSGKFVEEEVIARCLKIMGVRTNRKIIEAITSENKLTGNKKLLEFKSHEVVREYEMLRISKKEECFLEPKTFIVSGVKVTSYFGVEVEIKEEKISDETLERIKGESKEGIMWLNLGNIAEILIRPRRDGDTIDLGFGEKKLKDILIDEKVTFSSRRRVAVVEINKKVAGVFYGKIRVADDFLLRKGNQKICRIRF
ncbi:MAG: tRNA lysidine(34) synthetase TilS [Brevinematia bacterium]